MKLNILHRFSKKKYSNIKLDENPPSASQAVSCGPVAYPGILFEGGGCSTNSVEDRGQTERGSGGGSPLSWVPEAAVIWYKKFHFI